MNHLRAGDTLIVWRLDRLGRKLKHLIATIAEPSEKGICIGIYRARNSLDVVLLEGYNSI